MTLEYWDRRYRSGGHSGAGSRGAARLWKAKMINPWLEGSVLDVGSGDGHQARLLDPPGDYLGIDPSPAAVALARLNSPEKRFDVLALEHTEARDTHLSLDVIYHLIDPAAYRSHLELVFAARNRAIVYSSDHDHAGAAHVLHRHWTPDVPDGWEVRTMIPGPWSHADLYVFDRT